MYAQLCKFLVEKAPNFEPQDSIACTFKKLLLKKCRDEFENRSQISQQYEKMAAVSGGLNSDEEDSKYMAKRKMLGNIKFMGELGKLEIVQDTILHRCCEQLLVRILGINDIFRNLTVFNGLPFLTFFNGSFRRSAAKNNLFPTRRKIWSVSVTS